MKNFCLLLILASCFHITHAQLALVNDPDGFVSIRKNSFLQSPVTDTLHNGHLVYSINSENSWLLVEYNKNGKPLSGNIHQSRLIFLDSFATFKKQFLNDSTLVLQHSNIVITICSGAFNTHGNTIQYSSTSNAVQQVNNKTAYGIDGELPHKQYKKITIGIGCKQTTLDINLYADLFEPSLQNTNAFLSNDGSIYLAATNSDGAGAYTVAWQLKKGQCVNREVFMME